jgi:hypothetical protein
MDFLGTFTITGEITSRLVGQSVNELLRGQFGLEVT